MAHRDFQQNRLGGTKQPVNVLLQFEHAAMISADALKNAVAVKQTVIEHGHLRIALAAIFAVNVNFHQFVRLLEITRRSKREFVEFADLAEVEVGKARKSC